MNAVVVMRALLAAHAPLTALVDVGRIVAGTVPQGLVPAIGIRELSRSETRPVSLSRASALVAARVQVTVYAASYAQQKALIQAARLGPGAHTGVIAGVRVLSVLRDAVGPDLGDGADGVCEQARDFQVTYVEPN